MTLRNQTDIYMRLGYDDYKALEQQLRDWEQIETTHTTTGGFYHKAIRLRLGGVTLEIQGPLVMQPAGNVPEGARP